MEQLVNLRDLELTERTHARGGTFRSYALIGGRDGTAGNFFLQLSNTFGDFDSPRHRHNFDQIRLQLEGDADFARDGVMKPGDVGYFPEGVHYGPQTIAGESLTLVLQFGGASGSGYLSEAQFQQGIWELSRSGTFESGIYKVAKPDGGTRSQDAYEAVWEHVQARELRYPENRYVKPVFMRSSAGAWRADAYDPGLQRKHLGTFSEAMTQVSMLKLQPDVRTPVAANTLLFVLTGSGRAGNGDWEQHSSLYTGATGSSVMADTEAELLLVGLPQL